MKNRKNRVLALVLTLVMALGLVPSALAYTTPDFSDVPSNHWAYEAVMKMADAGIIKGVGEGLFAPEDKLTAEMFVVLVGRVVFPDVKAEGADWSGPYVAEAKTKGLLDGTNVTDATLKGEISRYDMAVILAKCVELLKVSATKADASKVTDYGEVPTKYVDAVLTAYGSGLIRGDQAGSFNGQNSMTRQEAATVMDRLLGLKGSSQGETTEPEQPLNADYSIIVGDRLESNGTLVLGESTRIYNYYANSSAVPYDTNKAEYTCTSSNSAVAEVTGFKDGNWLLDAVGIGTATITITDPCGVSGSMDITVVAQRDGIGTKTFPVSIWRAYYTEPSLRGKKYGKTTYVSDVPYKIYYTRDGGKTSQLVYEGITSDKNLHIELELPEDSFYSETAGLYMSAEAMINGQRMVTSDLRTDGRAYPDLHTVALHRRGEEDGPSFTFDPILIPPDGVKARFTFAGYVEHFSSVENANLRPEGFKVQLHYKDGSVLGEAITQADGVFSMDCAVDALDGGFQKYEKLYYVTVEGTSTDGTQYHKVPRVPLENYTMRSLVELHIEASEGVSTDHNYRIRLSSYDIVEN